MIAWGDPVLPPEMIPVFERHLRAGGEHAYLAGLALSSVGSPAKDLLIELLDDDDPDVYAAAADGLFSMNWSARHYRDKTAEDPVKVDEVFPKLVKLIRDKDGKLDWRIIDTLIAVDQERALALPEIRTAFQDHWKKIYGKQYTVWVYKKIRGKWVKQDDRTLVTHEERAREYVAQVQEFYPNWTATSDLPKD